MFFDKNSFAASMISLLTNKASDFEIQALEPTFIISINFEKYRKLLVQYNDLKLFHIYYLEQNWLIDKEYREVSLVQENASTRYQSFLQKYPNLESRLTQYHIASHLGITPTQLSRIKKTS